MAVRHLKRYASWVQNVVRQFGPYLRVRHHLAQDYAGFRHADAVDCVHSADGDREGSGSAFPTSSAAKIARRRAMNMGSSPPLGGEPTSIGSRQGRSPRRLLMSALATS